MNIEPQVFELFKKFDSEMDLYVKEKKGLVAEILLKLSLTALTPVSGVGQFKNIQGLVQEAKPIPKGFVILKQGPKMIYIGNWFDNYKNGFGYMLFDNGLVYKGEYKEDQKVNGVILNLQTK
jgi:hypothetical protein